MLILVKLKYKFSVIPIQAQRFIVMFHETDTEIHTKEKYQQIPKKNVKR